MKKIKLINTMPFREVYEAGRVEVIYYPFLESRIRVFSIALKKSFWMLVVAFRLLLRIEPKLD